MRLEHHLVGGYVRYISPHIIIIIGYQPDYYTKWVYFVLVVCFTMLSKNKCLAKFSTHQQLYDIRPWLK